MNKPTFEINLIKIPNLVLKFGGDKKFEVARGKNSKSIIHLPFVKAPKISDK